MDDFYRQWLTKNREENNRARQDNNLDQNNLENQINLSRDSSSHPEILDRRDSSTPQPGPSSDNRRNRAIAMNSSPEAGPSFDNRPIATDPTNIVYSNEKLEIFIEKGEHKRQNKFRLEVHLFYIKLRLKDPHSEPPLLRDILDFLEIAFNHILTNIKQFYNSEDHNVVFLTLFQEPMINGLNTGTKWDIGN